MAIELEVLEGQSNIRIDKYIADHTDLTRSRIQSMIKEGLVVVNGSSVKSNYKVNNQDRISIEEIAPEEVDIVPEDIPIEILYEDEDVLVVNKPKDMVVHPAPGHYSGTLVNAIMYHCKDNLSGINGQIRPGIVHRIDKDTTGSLIVCKNDIAHNHIAAQIKDHSLKRKYVGIVYGNFSKTEGVVDAPIGRSDKDRKKMCVTNKNSREAITHYRVLATCGNYSFLEFKLETGRTHQIRVHMSHIGHPLLGDMVYGPKKCPYKLQGQCLHAKTLGFIHPTSGEYIEVEADEPEYMLKLRKQLGLEY